MISRLTGWVTLFLVGTDLFVVSPLLPDIAHAVGLSPQASGATVTVFSVAYLVGGPLFGAIADRRGRMLVLSIALGVFAAANLVTALSPDAVVLLLSRAVAGLAAAGVTPSVYALIGAAAPAGKRATWLAVVTSGLLLALATGAPLGSILAHSLGWRGVFGVLAGAIAVAFLTVCIAHQSRRTATASADASSPSAVGDPHDINLPITTRLRAVSVTALWALSVYGVYTFLGSILTGSLHASETVVVTVLISYGLGAVAGNLAGGKLADRWGERATSLASLIGLSVAMVGVGVAMEAGSGALVAALLAVGLLAYPFFAAQQARLATAFPAAAGVMLAWNNSAMYAGILLGSALGGPVLHAFGPASLAWSSAGVAAVAVVVATMSTSRSTTQESGIERASALLSMLEERKPR